MTISSADVQIIKSARRTIGMHIEPGGLVVVRAPKLMPDFFIRRFLDENRDWIEKHRKAMRDKPRKVKRTFAHGERFLFMGNEVTLDIGPHKTIAINGTKLQFPQFRAFRIQKELTEWYQAQAKTIIKKFVHEHAKMMGVSYSEIYFSDTKSKWGSCSHDDRLQFNWRLIMAPVLVIRYVVIHELVHTKEKNHSRAFWGKVAAYNPSFRQQVKWLREHGHTLVLSG